VTGLCASKGAQLLSEMKNEGYGIRTSEGFKKLVSLYMILFFMHVLDELLLFLSISSLSLKNLFCYYKLLNIKILKNTNIYTCLTQKHVHNIPMIY
jgi:hypothetical protein